MVFLPLKRNLRSIKMDKNFFPETDVAPVDYQDNQPAGSFFRYLQ